MRLPAFVIVLLAVSGCSQMGSKDLPKADFDFGPLPVDSSARYMSNTSRLNILVYEVVGPAWLDSPSMYYRLAYQNAARPMPYAQSEWVMSPAALLTQRLRSGLSASSLGELRSVASDDVPVYALRAELFEFEQVFDQPDRSRSVLRLRATLEGQGMWSQRTFRIEKPAPAPDAAGGVAALSQCADELAVLISQWVLVNSASVSGTADLERQRGRLRAARSRQAED